MSQERVDPTLVAIPEAQWRDIAGVLTKAPNDDPYGGVNLGLEFMDKGPSGYSD